MAYQRDKSDLDIQLESLIKTKKLLSRDYIQDKWVGGFIIKRFLSFTSGDIEVLKQLTSYIGCLNTFQFTDKWDEYLFLFHTFPHIPKARFFYISKKKEKVSKKSEDNDKKINFLSETLEMSKKEVKYLLENKYIDINYE